MSTNEPRKTESQNPKPPLEMDQSIFGKLPAELRLQIYHDVFQNIRIIVVIIEKYSKTNDPTFRLINKVPEDTTLPMVCRAIRNETLPALWSAALVTFATNIFAYTTMPTIPWSCMVRIPLLGQVIDKSTEGSASWHRITRISGVKFRPENDGLEIDVDILLYCFPNLKVCNTIVLRI